MNAKIIAQCLALSPHVTLVAVSKTRVADQLIRAYRAGVRHFGENRIEEAEGKIPGLQAAMPEAIWHMIGHVQSRKAADVAALFGWVDSVDSLGLAGRLDRCARQRNRKVRILLQVNVAGEAAKFGFDLWHWEKDRAKSDSFLEVVRTVHRFPALRVSGLMTMPPAVTDPHANRMIFRSAKNLFDRVGQSLKLPDWKHLSMGTSQDYEVALEEGATMVRLGSTIFGKRA